MLRRGTGSEHWLVLEHLQLGRGHVELAVLQEVLPELGQLVGAGLALATVDVGVAVGELVVRLAAVHVVRLVPRRVGRHRVVLVAVLRAAFVFLDDACRHCRRRAARTIVRRQAPVLVEELLAEVRTTFVRRRVLIVRRLLCILVERVDIFSWCLGFTMRKYNLSCAAQFV